LQTNVTGALVTLTDGIAGEVRETSGDLDPHMWMVPDLVNRGYVTAIVEAFQTADPDNTSEYTANAERYRTAIEDLDSRIAEAIDTIPAANRKIVTSHDAYSYFAAAYGLDVIGTITGVSTEEEPSARDVSELIDRIRDEQVPAVFFETTINPALAERVASDADVSLGDPLYGDSVGEPGSGADDYVGMMEANARAIVAALGGTP
jgi:manganese/iron transport system substrate-binding protein